MRTDYILNGWRRQYEKGDQSLILCHDIIVIAPVPDRGISRLGTIA